MYEDRTRQEIAVQLPARLHPKPAPGQSKRAPTASVCSEHRLRLAKQLARSTSGGRAVSEHLRMKSCYRLRRCGEGRGNRVSSRSRLGQKRQAFHEGSSCTCRRRRFTCVGAVHGYCRGGPLISGQAGCELVKRVLNLHDSSCLLHSHSTIA